MRDLDAAVLTELDSDSLRIALLGEFEFLSGTVNIWAGPEGAELTYDGKLWTALGEIGQIDKLSEGQGLADSRTVVSLRLDSENIDTVDVEDSRGRNTTITLLLLGEEGEQIGPIDFRTTMGKVDIQAAAQVDDSGRKQVSERLALELLSETAQQNQTHFVRMTYEAGLRIDSADHGLEMVADPDLDNVGLDNRRGPRRPGPRERRR